MMLKSVRLLSIFCGILFLAGCVTHDGKSVPAAVASVDLDRYMGRWYVISHVPYFLERDKVATYDTYARRADGRLTNNFTFRKGSLEAEEKTWEGVAEVIDPTSNALWKVRFVWPFSTTYKILALDPEYRWAVVGTNDAGLLWVLSRERRLPADTYAAILGELRGRGISIDELRLVLQPPSD